MKVWSFYHPETGAFSRRRFSAANDRQLKPNTPDGLVPIEGAFDHLSQRVDVRTGEVVGYKPPRPSEDHEWEEGARRWVKRSEVLQRESRRALAIAAIEKLEGSQHRALREQALGRPDAAARLEAIDQEIAALRKNL